MAIVGGTECVSERELDTDDPRGGELLGDVGHHRDQYGRDACAFEVACEDGNVLATVGTVGCEHDSIDRLFFEHRCDFGASLRAPFVEAGALIAHDGDMFAGGGAHHAVGDELVECAQWQGDFVVGFEVGRVDMEVPHREVALVHVAGYRSPRGITPHGFAAFPVGIEGNLRRAREPPGREQRDRRVREPRRNSLHTSSLSPGSGSGDAKNAWKLFGR